MDSAPAWLIVPAVLIGVVLAVATAGFLIGGVCWIAMRANHIVKKRRGRLSPLSTPPKAFDYLVRGAAAPFILAWELIKADWETRPYVGHTAKRESERGGHGGGSSGMW